MPAARSSLFKVVCDMIQTVFIYSYVDVFACCTLKVRFNLTLQKIMPRVSAGK
jgi:hypothetical protein